MQPPDKGAFLWSTRGLMVVLASSVCGVGYLDRAAAGLLVVPMAEDGLGWSMEEDTRGRILSAFFTGYICTQIPGGLVAQRLGPRRVLGSALAVWSLAAMSAPEAGGPLRRCCSPRCSSWAWSRAQ
ncbi:unnamed protein product [Prorocentrum cordatum]|uniref:Major facilitator superfamily (MFS) profile domain-containing protein n=1 Tax=Prorocentrum cordatum TaxID=2364126 RepID=A0ABN9W903_9DINO|nr:unnamed protein product [Polarella glacialis]